MKNIRILMVLLVFIKIGYSQNLEECRKIINLTIESINNQSSEKLNKYLSDDFTIAGQKGEVARLVLKQLLSQLSETVTSHKELSFKKSDSGYIITHAIEYEKMGSKNAVFLFNKDNLLQDLSLFKMEVKSISGSSDVKKSSKDVLEIPFSMAGNLILVDVLVNGENKKFILDSGSPKVILNSKYYNEGEKVKTISSSKGVNGSISGMNIMQVEQLDLNGIQFNNQDVLTLDLAHLEEELEANIHGLIGFELVKDYDILFDYDKLMLTLIKPDTFEEYKNENYQDHKLYSIPFELKRHMPVVKARVESDGRELSFGIDCGAEMNLISDSLFSPLQKHLKKVEEEELFGADSKSKLVKKGVLQQMNIGDKVFEDLTTVFSDISHINKGYNLSLNGLIGYQVLSKQTTLISFVREEMIFIE